MTTQHGPADHTEHVDLLVIGWGKGGKTLAGTAARRGQRVAVLEQSAEMITYVSLDDNRIVSEQLFGAGQRSTADRVAVPQVIFLTPPLARVGLTETQAREQGYDVLVAAKQMADIAAAPRAKIEGEPRGIVKCVVDAGTDEVLGVVLMHVHSQEVINLVALAMRHSIPAAELRDAIYTHPSATEALNEVLGALA